MKFMNIRKFKITFKKIYTPLILLSLALYFSYHMFQGRHGLLAWGHLSKELHNRQSYLEALKIKQRYLEHKTDLLGNPICMDLLEEEAKKKLGLAHEDEVIIVIDK